MSNEKLFRKPNSLSTSAKPRTHAAPVADKSRKVVLCIGGSDSSGLAGIQMDGRFCQAMGVHQACVVTAITAQNNQGVLRSLITPVADCIAQFDAAMALKPQAIKIGFIASAEQLEWLCSALATVKKMGIAVIYDPVIIASSGDALSQQATAIASQKLLPYCDLVSPNIPEAEHWLHIQLDNESAIYDAGKKIQQLGADWVYLKGGHRKQAGDKVRDLILQGQNGFYLEQPWQSSQHLRGTGCALASTIAAAIALGYEMVDAVVLANMAVAEGIAKASAVNEQAGPVAALGFPTGYWPVYRALESKSTAQIISGFADCVGDHCGVDLKGEQANHLGLYPVVDSVQWLEKLLPLGISTIQLRIKDLSGDALYQEIKQSIALAKQYQCRLFINDHWQQALELGAYGIHLGQEDLIDADIEAIASAGIRLGISNHSHFELLQSLSLRPSYIACGPVFATQSKAMPWVPHGIAGLNYWLAGIASSECADRPVVAIGGIGEHNIAKVAATGVNGIALISAITEADNPGLAAKVLQEIVDKNQLQEYSQDGNNA